MVTDGLNPLTVLLFVGALLGGSVLLALYLLARLTRREVFARITSRVLLGGAAIYLTLFFGASLLSRNRVLAPGEEKHICEIDCHLAYSVVNQKLDTMPGGHLREVVTVLVRFDEQTISPRRSRTAPLTPNNRYVALVDEAGHEYPGSVSELKRPLIPGQSYRANLSFDLPRDVRPVRLVLRNDDPETVFIIGHENSLLHGKTTFRLPAS